MELAVVSAVALGLVHAGCDADLPTDDGGASSSTGSGSSSSGAPVPTGQHVFVTEGANETVAAFSILTDGGLTPVAGSPFALGPLGSGGLEHAVICAGRLYVATDDHLDPVEGIVAYDLDASGVPARIGSTPLERADWLACHEDRFLYAATSLKGIVGYAIQPDGSLVEVTTDDTADAFPFYRLASTEGWLLAISHGDYEVGVYAVDAATGTISRAPNGATWPDAVPLIGGSPSTDGRWFAWTRTGGAKDTLHMSTIGAAGITELPSGTYEEPNNGHLEHVFWVGTHLLVTTYGPNQILSFEVATNGAVTMPASATLALDDRVPLELVADPSGSRAYLLLRDVDRPFNHSLAALDVSATGALTFAPGSPVVVLGGAGDPHVHLR